MFSPSSSTSTLVWFPLKWNHHRRRPFYHLKWRCKDSMWPDCNTTRPSASFNRRMKLHLRVDQQWSSLFSCRFVYRRLTSEVENHLCVCLYVCVRCCFHGAARCPKVTGSLMRCFYAQGKWQHHGLPRGRVYEWPHREAVGEQPRFDGGPLIFTASETQRGEVDIKIR